MSKQHNKAEKRSRRESYIKRKKALVNAKTGAKASAKTPANA
ncbi:MAG: hypothetical protein WCR20_10015 [Verrucomicrobiota bacterium]|jgi:hypothetical protein|nr:hypothetical protein [Verrucomicrobiota bacterium]